MSRRQFALLLLTFVLLLLGRRLRADEPAPGIITTVAGTGVKGHTGDGGPATQATLNQPFLCDVDAQGNVYVAEAENHCIRKIALDGTIRTVAGTGTKGYSGDGGPATQATFHEPYAVAVAPQGDLYVVDRLNVVIRKVDGKTGVISTVAGTGTKGYTGDGGPGTQAQLREPNDCCLDGKGGLLIADVGDWRIRRLDLASGKIQTFAGTGRPAGKPDRTKNGDGGPATRAVLIGARAVCVDGQGNTYVCEREGHSIRKIAPDGTITTLAGTGMKGGPGDPGPARFNGPKGIRADRAGHLYVVDTENHAIRKIDARTAAVTTVAGGRKGSGGDGGPAPAAGLDRPHGCVLDGRGRLYIADSNNHRVRMVHLPDQ